MYSSFLLQRRIVQAAAAVHAGGLVVAGLEEGIRGGALDQLFAGQVVNLPPRGRRHKQWQPTDGGRRQYR
jgi:hypothetical protein